MELCGQNNEIRPDGVLAQQIKATIQWIPIEPSVKLKSIKMSVSIKLQGNSGSPHWSLSGQPFTLKTMVSHLPVALGSLDEVGRTTLPPQK